ncbi:hypothetical protein [Candidatus Enterococcus clewellii]|uniref:Phage head morphogenesis domain-containing protein n=1 Tax=Candidatus Enterococcus clewellii TaxID=1834193 RepID=A0A242K3Y5_9ENTE|nr:hypothetical protein [Enterococcus sp. 9E7_DIV0242]OTP13708.1 hypothetical protein A5888_003187 [Enterococcus sp. 9E7_DIV0242]
MVQDVVPDLLESIESQFDIRASNSTNLKKAVAMLKENKATYLDVNGFAIEVGDILADVLSKNLAAASLPDGKMHYNIADRLLNPTMKKNHDLISGFAYDVQTQLNQNANLRLKAQVPELNQDRIDGIVNRVSSEDDFEAIKWILDDPIVNFSQSIVDDSIEKNASFQSRSGLKPKIIRRVSGHACKWCQNLAGSYDYEDAPDDIYRRHERCRCTVEYDPGDGRKQDVWSKFWRNSKKKEEKENRKNLNAKDDKTLRIEALKRRIRDINIKTATPRELISIGEQVNDLYKIDSLLGDKEKLTEIFSNFRTMSGKIPKETWYNRSNKTVKAQLEKAFSYYPKDWADLLEQNNKKLFAGKTNRGFFSGELRNASGRQLLRGARPGEGLSIYADGTRKTTAYHEIGHLVEHLNPDLLRISKEFVAYRTEGEAKTSLTEIFPNFGYRYSEYTKRDNFISPYIGKEYQYASEVLSMGLESIYEPGNGQLFEISKDDVWFYKSIADDPEYLNLIIGMLLKG